ncbi:TonB-dependent receptor [Desertivirga arenae]|uniref:TonB-dependent receptor n=1 Tax=Desertivirga arenae TaxID=2810309 RepID=UPI001A96D6F3|nr:TonB-dependent receptor [Pedobacter sp. SYSU D00823]
MKSFLLTLNILLACIGLQAQTGDLSGKVFTADKKPAGNISLTIKNLKSTITNETGEFWIKGLKPGTYTISAKTIGGTAQGSVTIEAGKASKIELTLDQNSTELTEVTVKSYVSYRNESTNLATRTSTPLIEIPQSVQVITQQVIKDQQAFTINEVIRNVAGMNNFSTYQDYTMRGFRSNDGNFAYNGVRGALYQFDIPGQLYNVERIEAIKGPASSLFSTASPGGVVNIVTKQPLFTKKYEVQATYGTYNQYRLMADATGPLSSKLAYRFIVGYENADALSKNQEISHLFIAPSLRYNFSERTNATLELNIYNDQRTIGYERGILALQRADGTYNLEALPIRWSRNNPNDNSHTKGISSQLRFSHKLNDQISFHFLGRAVNTTQEEEDYTSNFNSLVKEGENILKNRYWQFFKQDPLYAYQANAYAEVKLATGGIHHTIVGGLDLGSSGRTYYYGAWGGPDLNIYSPNFSNDFPVDKSADNLNFGGETKEKTVLAGGYIQDQIDFGSRLKALIGLRLDTYDYTTSSTDDTAPGAITRDSSKADAFLPRLGLVYLPHPNVSIYGSYSEGFKPQYSNFSTAGGPFDPEKGVQYEVGVKAELLHGKLVPTLALYDLKKSNILIPDATDETGLRQTSAGEARSKGIEITVQGNVSEQLSVVTNYTYNETKNTNGGEFGGLQGEWYANAPQHTGNLWAKYSFINGAIKGLSINGGLQHVGERNTFTAGFKLPSYTIADAGLNYRVAGASFALNVYNLTDKRHYTGGYGRGIFWAGMPRSFRLTVGYRF